MVLTLLRHHRLHLAREAGGNRTGTRLHEVAILLAQLLELQEVHVAEHLLDVECHVRADASLVNIVNEISDWGIFPSFPVPVSRGLRERKYLCFVAVTLRHAEL